MSNFSLEEVAAHASSASCWIVFENDVYDVTHFVNEHPGGKIIFDAAGKDATQMFYDVGHSEGLLASFLLFLSKHF